uniref:WD_REPEATS_REGION domain-containing protein n=1 Tax=Macrostomum lignano TaxID=282301 RepID=A0A1I8H0S2_9PLAT
MPDSMGLVSGSVDRSIVRWNLAKEQQRTIVREHAHFVQGIACDPLGRLVATQSSDRTVRVYGCSARAVVIAKCVRNTEQQQQQQQQSNNYRLFADDSWKSFFRRLSFSPDGKVLAAPAGLHWNDNYCVHLFGRAKLDKPFASLVTGQSAPVAVRFCQRRFALAYHPQLELGRRRIQQDLVKLPYRWVFAVVLESGVLLCDTQHPFPIGALRNLHYQALNDAAWSADGSQLVLASTDGYCSIVRFGEGELGQPFAEPEKENLDAPQTPLAPPPPPPPTPQSSTKPPQAPPATRQLLPLTWRPADTAGSEASGAVRDAGDEPGCSVGWRWRQFGAWNADNSAPMTTSVAAAAAPSTVASTSAAGTSDNVDSPLRKKRRVSFFTISSCVGNGVAA